MASNTDDFDLDRICDQELLDSLTILIKPIFAREVNYNYYSFTDTQKQEYLNFHKESVVLSSDFVGVFCLPNSTESEKNFYVIRD